MNDVAPSTFTESSPLCVTKDTFKLCFTKHHNSHGYRPPGLQHHTSNLIVSGPIAKEREHYFTHNRRSCNQLSPVASLLLVFSTTIKIFVLFTFFSWRDHLEFAQINPLCGRFGRYSMQFNKFHYYIIIPGLLSR